MERTGNIEVVEAEDNFKRVHRSIIENETIDCETLGVYTRVIVLGKKWNLNIKGLSTHLKLSDTRIRKSINILEKEGFIVRSAVKKEDGKFAGWNYKVYPFPVDESERSIAGKRTYEKTDTPQNGHDRLPTIPFADMTESGEDNNNKLKEHIDLNNEQKVNNKKGFDLSFIDERFMDTMESWLSYKKEIKDSYKSERSIKACYNNLIKLSGNNPTKAMEIVNQSIANNWKGLFELKEKVAQKRKSNFADFDNKNAVYEEF